MGKTEIQPISQMELVTEVSSKTNSGIQAITGATDQTDWNFVFIH